MGRLVEFAQPDGTSVLVEVAEVSPAPAMRGMGSSAVAERAQMSFAAAIARVQPAVQGMISQLQALPEQPDEVQIVFGLDLHAQAGAFVTHASADANFSVSLTWRGSGPEAAHGQRPRD